MKIGLLKNSLILSKNSTTIQIKKPLWNPTKISWQFLKDKWLKKTLKINLSRSPGGSRKHSAMIKNKTKKYNWCSARRAVDGNSTSISFKNTKKFVKKCFSRKGKSSTLRLTGSPMFRTSSNLLRFQLERRSLNQQRMQSNKRRFQNGSFRVLPSGRDWSKVEDKLSLKRRRQLPSKQPVWSSVDHAVGNLIKLRQSVTFRFVRARQSRFLRWTQLKKDECGILMQ